MVAFLPKVFLPSMTNDARLKLNTAFVAPLLVVMSAIQIVNMLCFDNTFYQYGFIPSDTSTLYGIVLAPWIHFGWMHFLPNMAGLYCFGGILAAWDPKLFCRTTVPGLLLPPAVIWLISPNDSSYFVGASWLLCWYIGVFLVSWFLNQGRVTKGMNRFMLCMLALLIGECLLQIVMDTNVDGVGHLLSAVLAFCFHLLIWRSRTRAAWKNYQIVSKS